MRCLLASFLLLGSTVLITQPLLAQNGSVDTHSTGEIHQEHSTYRGKPLSYYLAQSQTASLRADALRSIGSFGSEAVPALPQLIAALKDPDLQVRMAAAWAISQTAPSANAGTVKALEQALSDSNPRMRSLAAVALRQIGSGAADAIPQLIACLDDPVAFVRAPAADALGAIGPAARPAVGPLSKRLLVKDEQVFVLRSIAYALGNIGPDARSAIPALEEALKMVRVSYAAQSAILKIKGLPVPSY
jgi:HEAT repeat protein